MPGHLGRDAAQDEPANVQARTGPKDDDICRFGLRRREDGLGRVTLPDEERGPDPGVASLSDDRLRAGGQSVPFLIDTPGTPAGQVKVVLLDHAENDQFRTIVLGELDRFSGGVTRRRCQVHRQQDPRPA